MNKPFMVTWLLSCVAASPAVAQDDLMRVARNLFEPIPAQAPPVRGIESTPARVALGRMLYFEPGYRRVMQSPATPATWSASPASIFRQPPLATTGNAADATRLPS